MTDFEMLRKLLDQWGVEYEHDKTSLTLTAGARRVGGYACFYSNFVFDSKGKFVEIGIWE